MALVEALKRKNYRRATELLNSEDVETLLEDDDQTLTPIFLAIFAKQPELVKLIVEKGADLDRETDDDVIIDKRIGGESFKPLLLAARLGQKEIVNLLLEKGVDVNQTNREGENALHKAVKSRDLEMVKLLLKKGGNPNQVSENAESPVGIAALFGDDQIVMELLQAGADANSGLPLYPAVDKKNLSTVKILLNRGADPNLKLENVDSPFEHAIKKGDLATIEMILDLYDTDLDQLKMMFESVKKLNPKLHADLEKKTLVGRLGPKTHLELIEANRDLKTKLRQSLPGEVRRLQLEALLPLAQQDLKTKGKRFALDNCERHKELLLVVLQNNRDLRGSYSEYYNFLDDIYAYVVKFC